MTDSAVKAFVEERPGMTFVGLLATDAGFSDFLSGEGNLKVVTDPYYSPRIKGLNNILLPV